MTKTIFVNTSIFVKENFLEGERIKTLYNLAKNEHIDIVPTEIIISEVKTSSGNVRRRPSILSRTGFMFTKYPHENSDRKRIGADLQMVFANFDQKQD